MCRVQIDITNSKEQNRPIQLPRIYAPMMELQTIQNKIYEIRGQRVMLDFDLAALYQVETRVLKQAVRRNLDRFEGDDFMFELRRKNTIASKTV